MTAAATSPQPATSPEVAERILFRFLREAPRLPGAGDLGVETSAVDPWPHQLRAVRRLVASYPQSFLLADEVGLGKTLEAGLALRQLLISGRVGRALILVPKSLLRQWQEELREKLGLSVPRYDGRFLVFPDGREVEPATANPWDATAVLLASSQLARRRRRQAELLEAQPWDLLIVDEAHHARRRSFKPGSYRPNRLLELLAGKADERGLRDRARAIYLLTATPMQVDPVEVWDLLRILGLGGLWGASAETFAGYFRELDRPFERRDWERLRALHAEALEIGGGLEASFVTAAEKHLGAERWRRVREFSVGVGGLDGEERAVLDALLRHHTPVRTFALRHTRALLRRYREEGRLEGKIPERRPENVWIAMTSEEQALYERIEHYVSHFYELYETERRGLGFVMTVYRRRLTSSFAAVRRSLERRLGAIEGRGSARRPGLDDDELEQEELDFDLGERLPKPDLDRVRFADERGYLEDFVAELAELGSDSKAARLDSDLEELAGTLGKVLVFTQYTDTMEALRGRLIERWGEAVGCYSGRGGELWGGESWRPVPKERVKDAFGRGEVQILLATEAASEGLNLQTCGALINYDMPWNPMRVEQRIGRIDRIGQVHAEVRVLNYFYRDTVEAEIYRRLGERIRWFEQVVGRAQPILHRVGEAIESVAMAPSAKRHRRLEEELARLRRSLTEAPPNPFEIPEDFLLDPPREEEGGQGGFSADLQTALIESQTVGSRFHPDSDLPGAYRLDWGGSSHRVTFSAELFDRHPSTLEFLTYGHPLLHELLEAVHDPPASPEPSGLGLYRTERPIPLSFFFLPAGEKVEAVTDLATLKRAQEHAAEPWTGATERAATVTFSQARREALRGAGRVEGARLRAERQALEEAARRVLERSALVGLARSRAPGLFDRPVRHGFGAGAVRALWKRGRPFRGLLRFTGREGLAARRGDPFYGTLTRYSPEGLDRCEHELATEGEELLKRIDALEAAERELSEPELAVSGVLERLWFPLPGSAPAKTGAREAERGPRRLDPGVARPFVDAVPCFDELQTAARHLFDDESEEEKSAETWVELEGRVRPARGVFVAPMPGRSLDRRIAAGAWCVFRRGPAEPFEGRVVLASHPDLSHPELGRGLALGVYRGEREVFADGSWRYLRIAIEPESDDPAFAREIVEDPEEGELRILAELVEVIA